VPAPPVFVVVAVLVVAALVLAILVLVVLVLAVLGTRAFILTFVLARAYPVRGGVCPLSLVLALGRVRPPLLVLAPSVVCARLRLCWLGRVRPPSLALSPSFACDDDVCHRLRGLCACVWLEGEGGCSYRPCVSSFMLTLVRACPHLPSSFALALVHVHPHAFVLARVLVCICPHPRPPSFAPTLIRARPLSRPPLLAPTHPTVTHIVSINMLVVLLTFPVCVVHKHCAPVMPKDN
jgi:hypothetical protein